MQKFWTHITYLCEITRYVQEMTHISNKKEYLLDENLMFYN